MSGSHKEDQPPPGLQAARLTAGEAQMIREILDDDAHPALVGREMASADASIFRKNN